MLTTEGCRARRERPWAALPEKPDWFLLSEPQPLAYFANFFASPSVYSAHIAMALRLLGAVGSSLLIAGKVL